METDAGLEGKGGCEGESSKVQAAVSFFGPTDLLAKDLPEASLGVLKEFLGGTAVEKKDEYRAASPVTHVSAGDAPLLILQGTKDPLIPSSQAYTLVDALTKAGVRARCELLVGAGHGWGEPDISRTINETYEFFNTEFRSIK